MDAITKTTLSDLNKRFYDSFAEAFAASRGPTEPGLQQVLAEIVPGDHVIDLGCGQGRLAALLPAGCTYTGVDYSAEMLRIAALGTRDLGLRTRFVQADLVRDAWETKLEADADWIILRAVLHHVPGYDDRLAVLTRASRVLSAGGRLLVATWQFLEIPRLRRRLAAWSEAGIAPDAVEPGDYLLDWRRDGRGLRYVHLVDEGEMQQLAADAALEIVRMYRADGHTNALTLYAIMRCPETGP